MGEVPDLGVSRYANLPGISCKSCGYKLLNPTWKSDNPCYVPVACVPGNSGYYDYDGRYKIYSRKTQLCMHCKCEARHCRDTKDPNNLSFCLIHIKTSRRVVAKRYKERTRLHRRFRTWHRSGIGWRPYSHCWFSTFNRLSIRTVALLAKSRTLEDDMAYPQACLGLLPEEVLQEIFMYIVYFRE